MKDIIIGHVGVWFWLAGFSLAATVGTQTLEDGSKVYMVKQVNDTTDEIMHVLNMIGAFLVIVSILKYLELLDTNYCIKLMLTYFNPTTSFLLKHLKYSPLEESSYFSFLSNNIVILLINIPLLMFNPLSPVISKLSRMFIRMSKKIRRIIVLVNNFLERDSEDYYSNESYRTNTSRISSNKRYVFEERKGFDEEIDLESQSSRDTRANSQVFDNHNNTNLQPPISHHPKMQEMGANLKAVVSNTLSSIKSRLELDDQEETLERDEESHSSSLNDLKELFTIFNTNRALRLNEAHINATAELDTLYRYIMLIKNLMSFLKNNYPEVYTCYMQHSTCKKCGLGIAGEDNWRFKRVEQHGLTYIHFEYFVLKIYAYYYLNFVLQTIKNNEPEFENFDTAIFFIHNISADKAPITNSSHMGKATQYFNTLESPVLEIQDIFRVIKTQSPNATPYQYLIEIYIEDVHIRPLQYNFNEGLIRMNQFEVYTLSGGKKTKCKANCELTVKRIATFISKASHPKTYSFTSKFKELTIRKAKAVDRGEYFNLQEVHQKINNNFVYCMSPIVVEEKEEEFKQTHRYLVELLMVFVDRMIFYKDYEWGLISLDFGGYCWLSILKSFPDSRYLFFTKTCVMNNKELNILILERLSKMHFHERNKFLTLPVIYNPYFINVSNDLGSVNLYDFMLASEDINLGLNPSARDDTFVSNIYSLYRNLS